MIAGGRSSFAAAATAKPSRSGIWMSRNTRSGGGGAPRRSSSTASRPLAHSSIRVTVLICCSTPRSRRRAGASSSTMIARMIGERDVDRRDGAAGRGRRRVGQLEAVTGTVQLDEPRPRIREAESAPASTVARGAAVSLQAGSVVTHLQVQAVTFSRGGDLDFRHLAVGDDTVPDRVLHERLQQQRGDHGGRGVRIDAERHAQPITEARFLYGDVVVQQLELLLESDEGTAFRVKRLPE